MSSAAFRGRKRALDALANAWPALRAIEDPTEGSQAACRALVDAGCHEVWHPVRELLRRELGEGWEGWVLVDIDDALVLVRNFEPGCDETGKVRLFEFKLGTPTSNPLGEADRRTLGLIDDLCRGASARRYWGYHVIWYRTEPNGDGRRRLASQFWHAAGLTAPPVPIDREGVVALAKFEEPI